MVVMLQLDKNKSIPQIRQKKKIVKLYIVLVWTVAAF